MSDLTETQFACLQDAVRIAREKQVPRVNGLKAYLRELDYKSEDIEVALVFWAKSIRASYGHTSAVT